MPVQSVNVNNVSMDYFLRGVEAAKPKDAPQVPQKAQAGTNAVAAPELEAAERTFEMEFDVNGGLNVNFRARQNVTAVITGADATPSGAGSEVTMTLDLHVNAEELDRIGGVDFAAYDDKPITRIIDNDRPENVNKFVKAKFALPERFRLAIDVGPGLVADLK